jgi:predicted MFS family arabinose efflux permease
VGNDAPLRRDRDFRRYWTARTVSLAGSGVTYVVLPVLVYRMTHSGLWTGLVTATEALPYLCFGLFAGAFADRADRKRLMVSADLGSAVVLLTVPVAYFAGALTPTHVVAAGFAAQTLFVFFDAANFGALPALAGRDRLAAATSAVHASNTVLDITVPMAAGAAVAVVAPAPLLAVDAASFLGSALLIRGIRRQLAAEGRPSPTSGWRRDVTEGLRFIVRHPVVRVQTVIGVLSCVSFGIFFGQLVPWADRVLGVPPNDARLGLLFGGWGIGGLAAATIYPPLARRLGEIRVALGSLPLAALTGVVLALSRHWAVAVVAIAAWGLPVTVAILNAITLRAKVTPDRLQSRVNTTGRMLGFGAGTPLGAVVGGLVTGAYGPTVALYVSAAVLLVVALVAWLSPLRGYRRDPAMVAVAD